MVFGTISHSHNENKTSNLYNYLYKGKFFTVPQSGSSGTTTATGVYIQDNPNELVGYGRKLFVSSDPGTRIIEFDLTTPYDISTAVYLMRYIPATGFGNITDFTFNYSGTYCFVCKNQTNGQALTGLPLVTPWTFVGVSTASATLLNLAPSNSNAYTGIDYAMDPVTRKEYIYCLHRPSSNIHQYDVSNLLAVTFVGQYTAGPFAAQNAGLHIKIDGRQCYRSSDSGRTIYEVTLTVPYMISSAVNNNVFVNVNTTYGIPRLSGYIYGIHFTRADYKQLTVLITNDNTFNNVHTMSLTT
jgi:hypothetical protein